MQGILDSFAGFLDISRYYGTDWLAVICTGVYLWRVGDKRRDGFLWGAAGNVFFIAFNLLAQSPPALVFNAGFLLLNIRAWVRWRQPESVGDSPRSENPTG